MHLAHTSDIQVSTWVEDVVCSPLQGLVTNVQCAGRAVGCCACYSSWERDTQLQEPATRDMEDIVLTNIYLAVSGVTIIFYDKLIAENLYIDTDTQTNTYVLTVTESFLDLTAQVNF